MCKADVFEKLPQVLLPWYAQNKRDLPWRKDQEPYHIWLSEIMLQQTRVEAVKGYYSRFLDRIPTIKDLANADDEVLHKLWEGLGYYSRVRNLKKAARVIMDTYGGEFPGEYEKILKLPGIGAYTAGAVCSIAFGQRTPAVDGNVLRVVARLCNDTTPVDLPAYKKRVSERLTAVYPKDAGAFTQALMELGATVCGPNREPDCKVCPCKAFCEGYRCGTAAELPVKLPRRSRKRQRMTVFILSCGNLYAVQKRPETGLLASLWQFPNVQGKFATDEAIAYVEQNGIKLTDIKRTVEKKHVFTHVEWDMNGVYMEVTEPAGPYVWLSAEQIRKETALPTAFRQFWEEIDNV